MDTPIDFMHRVLLCRSPPPPPPPPPSPPINELTKNNIHQAYIDCFILPGVLALSVDGVEDVVKYRGRHAQEHDGILCIMRKRGTREREGEYNIELVGVCTVLCMLHLEGIDTEISNRKIMAHSPTDSISNL